MPFGALGNALGGLIGTLTAGEGGKDEYKRAARLFADLESPQFDFSQLSPAQLQMVARMVPQTYEAAQPTFQGFRDSPEVRDQQIRALEQLARVRTEGLPLAERLAAQNQQEALGHAYRQTVQSALRNLAERGRLSGGGEIAARMMAAQQAANLARGQGADLASLAAYNRLGAAQDTGQLGGQIRAQDVATRQANADMLNRFNLAVTGRLDNAAQYAADARNQAQAYNVGQGQRIADTNVASTYANQLRNQEYPNELRQQQYANALNRAAGQAGQLGNLGAYRDSVRNQRVNLGRGLGEGVGGLLGLLPGLGG